MPLEVRGSTRAFTCKPQRYTPDDRKRADCDSRSTTVMKKRSQMKRPLEVQGISGPFTCSENALPLSYTPDDRKRTVRTVESTTGNEEKKSNGNASGGAGIRRAFHS
ncbi:hypothetical protein AVEN_149376-1 [Araneus ventricosus]|uniref:Uncharacterized protein n=1 Tax=Araneus ventricosus TaxID=182803 RepID=A0A4Y2WKS6_ARAVE|nr:hypothetical protein AVEN_149376-1 [Araneus ventricosus]